MASAPPAAPPLPPVALHDRLSGYAHRPDVQDLLQAMVADLLSEQPDDAVAYLAAWLEREARRRRDDGGIVGGASS